MSTAHLSWLPESSAACSLDSLISARLDRLPDLEQSQLAVLSTLGLRIRTGLIRFVLKTKRLLHEAIRPFALDPINFASFCATSIGPLNSGLAQNRLTRAFQAGRLIVA